MKYDKKQIQAKIAELKYKIFKLELRNKKDEQRKKRKKSYLFFGRSSEA